MRGYIAAGFDPSRFWELTPRLYSCEMEGAADRAEIRMRDVWFSGMLGRLENPPKLDDFIGRKSRNALSDCLSQWDRVDAALSRNKAA